MNSRRVLLGAVVLAALAVAVFVSLDDRDDRASRDDARASNPLGFVPSERLGEARVSASEGGDSRAPHRAPEGRPSEHLAADVGDADAAGSVPSQTSSGADQRAVSQGAQAEPYSAQGNEGAIPQDPAPHVTMPRAPQLSERSIVLSERIRKMAGARGHDAGSDLSGLNGGRVSAEEWKRRLLDFRRARPE